MQTLLHLVYPTLQQATADICLSQSLLDTHRQVWVSLLWGHCSFLLGHSVHKVLFVPSKSVVVYYLAIKKKEILHSGQHDWTLNVLSEISWTEKDEYV